MPTVNVPTGETQALVLSEEAQCQFGQKFRHGVRYAPASLIVPSSGRPIRGKQVTNPACGLLPTPPGHNLAGNSSAKLPPHIVWIRYESKEKRPMAHYRMTGTVVDSET
ncbi:uncharacterized protein HMPREF1120_03530 [Exophiala dermatitidis NIH/UT8656]|uniref:Uncharacterized protein n=1 Tax=Exophiala dermatitidis (strain ATCC 34100 / CBS 525.76 / NIH/UT8656) TaxID=858893 RepID=H6BXG0_EXODN|nr:uncharacterized protein HMPREF1120_03530 [Exophiala dermatitidis NIH/UT8656]EHY55391.1 hypothetical protein HMPREF1120_03530 [Exophiala dermatitidis NIH/UT8656]